MEQSGTLNQPQPQPKRVRRRRRSARTRRHLALLTLSHTRTERQRELPRCPARLARPPAPPHAPPRRTPARRPRPARHPPCAHQRARVRVAAGTRLMRVHCFGRAAPPPTHAPHHAAPPAHHAPAAPTSAGPGLFGQVSRASPCPGTGSCCMEERACNHGRAGTLQRGQRCAASSRWNEEEGRVGVSHGVLPRAIRG